METKMTKKMGKNRGIVLFLVALTAAILLSNYFAVAVPSGPSIEYKDNQTSSSFNIPTIEDNADSEGGTIITLVLTARQPNSHYKAYVGNVTGAYVLEDASDYSIYEWSTSIVGGEVYATRNGNSITWSNVVCANISHIQDEMAEMHHNSTNTPSDPLNDTFDDDANDHWSFEAGSAPIAGDSCNYSINTYVNDTAQTATDWFDEVLLYDGSGDIIYATKIENNKHGYHTGENTTYDFQMLVAENGSSAVTQTDYYFYVELS